MATADEEAMEGHRGSLGVEEAADPVGALSVGQEGYGRGAGVFAHYESGMRCSQESISRGDGGGERRGGGPRPALECTFRLSFLLGGWRDGIGFLFFSFLCFSFIFILFGMRQPLLSRGAQGSARHGKAGITMKAREWRPSEWSLGNEDFGTESWNEGLGMELRE